MRLSARRHLILMIVALTCMGLFTASVGQASPAEQGQGQSAAIHLRAATFVPTQGQAPQIPPGLAIAGYPEGQKGYYIVQFVGPVEQAWKDAVAARGADVLEYIPDFAFKVRMNPGQSRQVEQLDSVAWVGLFHPAYKLDPATAQGTPRLYKVRVERGGDMGQTIAAIARSGAVVGQTSSDLLLVAADAAQLEATARTLDVAWIEEYKLPQKHNAAEGVIMGANIAHGRTYNGSTQTVAVADTGLGDGTKAGAHTDIEATRIVAIYNWPGATDSCFSTIIDDGAKDVDSAHGTHVSGSVLSSGASTADGEGIAPAANLVFQATENYVRTSSLCKNLYGYQDGYYLTGLPSDLHTLFQQAYDAGARIHSNSWGSSQAGAYTTNSANADDFIWTHRDMTITFSAGNDGTDANSDGIVDSGSVGSPATAKNVITVGASESERRVSGALSYPCDTSLTYTSHDAYQPGQTCSTMSGNNASYTGTYGSRYPSDFPTAPLAGDAPADNAEQMAAWSSRGPADDGRIKPDVVAPGTWVLSTYSPLYQEGYGTTVNPQDGAYQWDGYGMPLNSLYKYMGGTSMSNPLVAGSAAVVRDYYQKARGASASAALVKATLINSAVDLADENNDGVNDNDYPIPNVHEGWGRVNLDKATAGTAQFRDGTVSLSTGATATYTANVGTAGALKITLVWSDYASATSATKNLVNDLDLEVTAPNGTLYRGNNFSGGWSTATTTVDRTNNVENVYLQSAAIGTWTIKVKGYNVPNGPQPFALVVDGVTSLADAAAPTLPAAPSNLNATALARTRIDLSWTDNASNEDGVKIERCRGTNCTSFTQIATVAASNATSYSDTTVSKGTTYRYRVRAYNAAGNSAYSNTVSATTPR